MFNIPKGDKLVYHGPYAHSTYTLTYTPSEMCYQIYDNGTHVCAVDSEHRTLLCRHLALIIKAFEAGEEYGNI